MYMQDTHYTERGWETMTNQSMRDDLNRRLRRVERELETERERLDWAVSRASNLTENQVGQRDQADEVRNAGEALAEVGRRMGELEAQRRLLQDQLLDLDD